MVNPPTPHRTIEAQLRQHLASLGLFGDPDCWVPLSGGRSNRLWRVQANGKTCVVKLFAASDDNPLFPNTPTAEAQLLTHLAGTGLAPRLIAEKATPLGQVIVYSHVDGASWAKNPEPVARALRRLHDQPVPHGLPHAADGAAALVRQTRRILSLCPSQDSTTLSALIPAGGPDRSGEFRLLHGDCVPGNIIVSHTGVTLIDWQCPAVGDPVHDLAVFLSPAMQQVYRGAPLTPDQIARFLDAYDDPETVKRYKSLAPWFHLRMAAYCLWRVANGAMDYRRAFVLEQAAFGA